MPFALLRLQQAAMKVFPTQFHSEYCPTMQRRAILQERAHCEGTIEARRYLAAHHDLTHLGTGRGRSRNIAHRIPINRGHSSDLLSSVLFAVLYDAQTIDPQKAKTHVTVTVTTSRVFFVGSSCESTSRFEFRTFISAVFCSWSTPQQYKRVK
jgi:hypothetical protein